MLTDTLLVLTAKVGYLLKHLRTEARYVLDSFPIAVCHKAFGPRTSHCKLLTAKGISRSLRQQAKLVLLPQVQVVATRDGLLVDFHIHADAKSRPAGTA